MQGGQKEAKEQMPVVARDLRKVSEGGGGPISLLRLEGESCVVLWELWQSRGSSPRGSR